MGENELDLELVKRVQRGDKTAFDVLVLKYQHRIGAVIGRFVPDYAESQDIAQESFIRAYRAIANFRGDSQFYTWIYKIAHNAAIDHLRRHRAIGSRRGEQDARAMARNRGQRSFPVLCRCLTRVP